MADEAWKTWQYKLHNLGLIFYSPEKSFILLCCMDIPIFYTYLPYLCPMSLTEKNLFYMT